MGRKYVLATLAIAIALFVGWMFYFIHLDGQAIDRGAGPDATARTADQVGVNTRPIESGSTEGSRGETSGRPPSSVSGSSPSADMFTGIETDLADAGSGPWLILELSGGAIELLPVVKRVDVRDEASRSLRTIFVGTPRRLAVDLGGSEVPYGLQVDCTSFAPSYGWFVPGTDGAVESVGAESAPPGTTVRASVMRPRLRLPSLVRPVSVGQGLLRKNGTLIHRLTPVSPVEVRFLDAQGGLMPFAGKLSAALAAGGESWLRVGETEIVSTSTPLQWAVNAGCRVRIDVSCVETPALFEPQSVVAHAPIDGSRVTADILIGSLRHLRVRVTDYDGNLLPMSGALAVGSLNTSAQPASETPGEHQLVLSRDVHSIVAVAAGYQSRRVSVGRSFNESTLEIRLAKEPGETHITIEWNETPVAGTQLQITANHRDVNGAPPVDAVSTGVYPAERTIVLPGVNDSLQLAADGYTFYERSRVRDGLIYRWQFGVVRSATVRVKFRSAGSLAEEVPKKLRIAASAVLVGGLPGETSRLLASPFHRSGTDGVAILKLFPGDYLIRVVSDDEEWGESLVVVPSEGTEVTIEGRGKYVEADYRVVDRTGQCSGIGTAFILGTPQLDLITTAINRGATAARDVWTQGSRPPDKATLWHALRSGQGGLLCRVAHESGRVMLPPTRQLVWTAVPPDGGGLYVATVDEERRTITVDHRPDSVTIRVSPTRSLDGTDFQFSHVLITDLSSEVSKRRVSTMQFARSLGPDGRCDIHGLPLGQYIVRYARMPNSKDRGTDHTVEFRWSPPEFVSATAKGVTSVAISPDFE